MLRCALFAAVVICVGLHSTAALPAETAKGFGDLVPALLPTVVNIYSRTVVTSTSSGTGKNSQKVQGRPRERQVLGSGFIIDPSGVIVTNQHVIAGGYDIRVLLQDNTTLTARVIGASTVADIALLKVNAARALPTVKFGDSSKLRIGDRVFAVGNPLGLGGSVSAGIVSALNRDIMLSPYDDFIQTDAAINHGNSGGPLFDADGDVVGVNTALFAPNGETGSVGLGFAKPINDAAFVIGQLRQYGYVHAGYLGADLQPVTSDIAAAVALPNIGGAIINSVDPGGPAAKAGLQQGDVIVKAGDRELADPRAVSRAIAQAPLNQVLELGVWRGGKEVTAPVTVQEWPGDHQHAAPATTNRPQWTPDLGLHLSVLTAALRRRYRLTASQTGVLIEGVTPLSPADDRGLRAGEVIDTVQMSPVRTPADVLHAFSEMRDKGGRYALVLVEDAKKLRSVALPLHER